MKNFKSIRCHTDIKLRVNTEGDLMGYEKANYCPFCGKDDALHTDDFLEVLNEQLCEHCNIHFTVEKTHEEEHEETD